MFAVSHTHPTDIIAKDTHDFAQEPNGSSYVPSFIDSASDFALELCPS
jgi:hypothetical protein